jgi:hypothetical protein
MLRKHVFSGQRFVESFLRGGSKSPGFPPFLARVCCLGRKNHFALSRMRSLVQTRCVLCVVKKSLCNSLSGGTLINSVPIYCEVHLFEDSTPH